jgi:hypothetical protein
MSERQGAADHVTRAMKRAEEIVATEMLGRRRFADNEQFAPARFLSNKKG